jgi:hypothetical protein
MASCQEIQWTFLVWKSWLMNIASESIEGSVMLRYDDLLVSLPGGRQKVVMMADMTHNDLWV